MRRLASGVALVLVILVILFALTYRSILGAVGDYLVEEQAPAKADVALVLAGDWRGGRILRAGELVREGWVPVALISGPMEMYGVNEATLAIQFAQNKGFPPQYFQPITSPAFSTLDEARAIEPELRKRNVKSLLLVTTTFHTRRAGAIYRGMLGRDVRVTAVSSRDEFFGPHTWWHTREGQKTVFYEVSKTIAGWIGL